MPTILDRLQANRFVLGIVAAAAAVGGLWSGLFAGALSFPLFIYFFLNRPRSFDVAASRVTSLVVLGLGCALVAYIVARERRARALSAGAREVDDSLGRLLEAINPDDRDEVRSAFGEALSSGSDFEVEVRTSLAPGGWCWVQFQGGVRRGLRGKRVSGLVRDVTTGRRSVERERFLGGLTRTLAVASDYEGMMSELAR